MEITIDANGAEPLFSQLATQIRQAVIAGDIEPGEPLKSIRQLAADLDLNNKTVARAYKLLERDKIVQTRGYRGTIIHPNAIINSHKDPTSAARKALTDVVDSLHKKGITDSEIRSMMATILKTEI